MRSKRSVLIFILALIIFAISVYCEPAYAAGSTTTAVSLPDVAVVIKGKTLQLNAVLTPSDVASAVTWKSWNTDICTISSKGLITGVKTGAAYVQATVNGKYAKTLVRVIEKTGWTTSNGKKLYYSPTTGLPLKGWQIINGKQYYFNTSGIMLTGFQMISGGRYYFDLSTGEMKTGLIKTNNGYTYNFLNGGAVSKGLTMIDGKTYFFNASGQMKTGLQTINEKTYFFNSSGVMCTGFRLIGDKRYFFDLITGEMKIGLIKADNGYTYNFLNGGYVSKNMQTVNGRKYYFDPNSGVMKTGLITAGNGLTYYFLPEGGVATGFKKIGEKRYYFHPSYGGAAREGLFQANGYTYHFLARGEVSKGLTQIGNDTYYFNTYGQMLTGLRKVNGKTYYFGVSGKMQKNGLTLVGDNKVRYYFDPQTGEQRTGVIKAGDYYYNFLSNGDVSRGFTIIGTKRYYFSPASGVALFGLLNAGNGYTYHFLGADDESKVGEVSKGLTTIGSDTYYFNSYGQMQTGVQKVNGKTYYFGTVGKMQKQGLTLIGDAKVRYYFDQVTGEQRTGLVKAGSYYYYFLPEGDVLRDFHKIGSKYYNFSTSSGAALLGKQKVSDGNIYNFLGAEDESLIGEVSRGWTDLNNTTYYFDPVNGTLQSGFVTIDGKKYYFHPAMGGALYKPENGLFKDADDNDKWYYLDPETGEQKTGVIKFGDYYYNFLPSGGVSKGYTVIGEKRYNFNMTSGAAVFGWQKVSDGCWYDFLEGGEVTRGWKEINGSMHYFDSDSGRMLFGWQTIDGKKYYLEPEYGILWKSGRTLIDGISYYLDEKTGEMCSGFKTVDNRTYYFLPEGDVAKGLIELKGQTYYFEPEYGIMQEDLQVIDGKRYFFEHETGEMVTGVRTSVKFGYTYYFDPTEPNGYRYGLQTYDGEQYLLHPDSGYALTGYQTINGCNYYFDPSNFKMVKSTSWEYSGLGFEADGDGILQITLIDNLERTQILYWALTHVGTPYGFDHDGSSYSCSSFVAAAYSSVGITLLNDKESWQQALAILPSDADIFSSLDSLRPGDLVFFNKESGSCDNDDPTTCKHVFLYGGNRYHVHHVGIYMGNRQIVEAAESIGTCLVHNMLIENDNFYMAFCTNLIGHSLTIRETETESEEENESEIEPESGKGNEPEEENEVPMPQMPGNPSPKSEGETSLLLPKEPDEVDLMTLDDALADEPFIRSIEMDGVRFYVEAEAGVFPSDAALYVEPVWDKEIEQLFDAALAADETYTHHLYRIEIRSGKEFLSDSAAGTGTAIVRIENADVDSQIKVMFCDESQSGFIEMEAVQDANADNIQFLLKTSGIYDIATLQADNEDYGLDSGTEYKETELKGHEFEKEKLELDAEEKPVTEAMQQRNDAEVANDEGQSYKEWSAAEPWVEEMEVDELEPWNKMYDQLIIDETDITEQGITDPVIVEPEEPAFTVGESEQSDLLFEVSYDEFLFEDEFTQRVLVEEESMQMDLVGWDPLFDDLFVGEQP